MAIEGIDPATWGALIRDGINDAVMLMAGVRNTERYRSVWGGSLQNWRNGNTEPNSVGGPSKNKSYILWFVGHSLGGSVALVMAKDQRFDIKGDNAQITDRYRNNKPLPGSAQRAQWQK